MKLRGLTVSGADDDDDRKELQVNKPCGEIEFLLAPKKRVAVRAKGPFLITELTLREWTRSDARATLGVRNVTAKCSELTVALRNIALRRLWWPTLVLLDEPEVHVEFQVLESKHLVELQIHYEKVIP